MVSLKKEPRIRKVTPVHLIDEEETVCTNHQSTTEDLTKDAVNTKDDRKEKTSGLGLDKQDIIEAIIIAVLLTAFLLFISLFCGKFLGEGFQLVRDIAF